jgi:hypothetical protein
MFTIAKGAKLRVPKVAGPGRKLSCANSDHISPFSADLQLSYSIKTAIRYFRDSQLRKGVPYGV